MMNLEANFSTAKEPVSTLEGLVLQISAAMENLFQSAAKELHQAQLQHQIQNSRQGYTFFTFPSTLNQHMKEFDVLCDELYKHLSDHRRKLILSSLGDPHTKLLDDVMNKVTVPPSSSSIPSVSAPSVTPAPLNAEPLPPTSNAITSDEKYIEYIEGMWKQLDRAFGAREKIVHFLSQYPAQTSINASNLANGSVNSIPNLTNGNVTQMYQAVVKDERSISVSM